MCYLSVSQAGLENPSPPDYLYKQHVKPKLLFSLYWDSLRSFKTMNWSDQFKTLMCASGILYVLLVEKIESSSVCQWVYSNIYYLKIICTFSSDKVL